MKRAILRTHWQRGRFLSCFIHSELWAEQLGPVRSAVGRSVVRAQNVSKGCGWILLPSMSQTPPGGPPMRAGTASPTDLPSWPAGTPSTPHIHPQHPPHPVTDSLYIFPGIAIVSLGKQLVRCTENQCKSAGLGETVVGKVKGRL